MPSYELKRGDTFSLAGPARLPAGVWTARSQVRQANNDGVVATLAVILTAQGMANANPALPSWTHLISLSAPAAATATWPIADLQCDIEFTDASGVVRSTKTFVLRIVKDVTRV